MLEELTGQFLAILSKQGFNTRYIAPYLKHIIYNEYGNEVDSLPTEGQIRFEVHYPEMNPICQYCGWENGKVLPRNEWFIPAGYDIIFGRDKNDPLGSFYSAFKHAAATAMLNHLDIPLNKPPWHKGE